MLEGHLQISNKCNKPMSDVKLTRALIVYFLIKGNAKPFTIPGGPGDLVITRLTASS